MALKRKVLVPRDQNPCTCQKVKCVSAEGSCSLRLSKTKTLLMDSLKNYIYTYILQNVKGCVQIKDTYMACFSKNGEIVMKNN